MKLVHLTDPFLPASRNTHNGTGPSESLEASLVHIEQHHPDAVMGIVTGDLADTNLRRLLEASSIPWRLLPGNRDRRGPFQRLLGKQPSAGYRFLDDPVDCPAGRFLFLDTLDEGSASGRLCPYRLDWLQEALSDADADDKDVFLVMHHPPFDTGIYGDDPQRLRDREQFSQVLAGSPGRLRHLFLAQVHRPIHGVWRGVGFSSLPGLNHQVRLSLRTPQRSFDDPIQPPLQTQAYGVVVIEQERKSGNGTPASLMH